MNTAYYGDKNTPVIRSKVLTVFYDGGCPICAREVGMYQSLKGAEFIKWVNLSALLDGEVLPGVTKRNALARFHAVDYKGNIHVGGAAFVALWCMLQNSAYLVRCSIAGHSELFSTICIDCS